MEEGRCSVCVTGGAGYIASALVKKLLCEGYTVHATLRNLNDSTKVQLLRSFCGAEERLKLFEADIYKPEEFEAAVKGCEFVFHVATPLLHTEGYKHRNRVDATVDAARSIATACIRSRTVRRLIYTASVMAASPLKDDGSGFKELMDETCWTPLNFSIVYSNEFLEDYTRAKTLAEKELLSFGSDHAGEMEVVTLPCGLVGGESLMPYLSGSLTVFLAQITNDELALNSLKFVQELLAKIPVVHIEDVCNAHIFCMKEASMNGRFL
ncbi:UNVERIFIED_CONTAM: putative anthocyanidin reductase [Sesamum radiatum]|uniref:Dihydroflavonol 4-reductase n=1 Tax=Sesamum radiatum TaxID=300843 RepID=A0AAW2R2K5_SESRA